MIRRRSHPKAGVRRGESAISAAMFDVRSRRLQQVICIASVDVRNTGDLAVVWVRCTPVLGGAAAVPVRTDLPHRREAADVGPGSW